MPSTEFADSPEAVLSDPELRRYIGDGVERQDVEPRELPSQELLIELFRTMVVLRVLDERIVAFQRQGRCGTNPTYYGEEAVMAAPALAARPDDWLFPTYRQTVIGVVRGMDAAFRSANSAAINVASGIRDRSASPLSPTRWERICRTLSGSRMPPGSEGRR